MATNGQRIVRGYGLHEYLKEHKPSKLIAIDSDGEETKINVPEVRNRHARVMTTLKEIAWVRVDMLDKKDGLVYRHQRNADDRDQPATDIEDLAHHSRSTAEQATLLSLMLRAQETVLIRHQQAMQQVLDATMKLVDTAMKRLELQEVQYEHAMRLNHSLSSDLVSAQLSQLQLAAPQVDEDGNARPESDRALASLIPMMMRAALDKKEHPGKVKKNGVSQKAAPERQAPSATAPTG